MAGVGPGLAGAADLPWPCARYPAPLAGAPGPAGGMLALQRLVAELRAAFAFAAGSFLGGSHATTAFLGAGVAVTGAMALLWIDRKRV